MRVNTGRARGAPCEPGARTAGSARQDRLRGAPAPTPGLRRLADAPLSLLGPVSGPKGVTEALYRREADAPTCRTSSSRPTPGPAPESPARRDPGLGPPDRESLWRPLEAAVPPAPKAAPQVNAGSSASRAQAPRGHASVQPLIAAVRGARPAEGASAEREGEEVAPPPPAGGPAQALGRGGGLRLRTQGALRAASASRTRTRREEQVVTTSEQEGFFFFFPKNKCAAWKSKLAFRLRKFTLAAAALSCEAQTGKHLGDFQVRLPWGEEAQRGGPHPPRGAHAPPALTEPETASSRCSQSALRREHAGRLGPSSVEAPSALTVSSAL